MQVNKKIFLSEHDIRSIIKDYLTKKGYNIIGDLKLNSRSKDDIPKGAYGDLIGFEALVEEYKDNLLETNEINS